MSLINLWFRLKRPLDLLLCGACFFLLSGFTVMGHRGDPLQSPEETFQSFDEAFQAGANYAELDLHESKDGALVISHDRNLKRTTGDDLIISKTNFDQLQGIKYANGEPIHSLTDLFSHYQNQPDAHFVIETKKSKKNKPKDMEEKVAALIQQYHMEDRVILQSFSAKSVLAFSELLPQIPRYLLVNDLSDIDFETLQAITGINIDFDLATPNIIQQIHALHKQVFVWSRMDEQPTTLANISLANIDGVVTNYPELAKNYAQAKAGTKQETPPEQTATLSTTYPIASVTNPYLPWTPGKSAKAQQTYQVSTLTKGTNQPYAALNNQQWLNSNYLNFGQNGLLAAPYLAGTVTLKPKITQWPLVASPSQPQQIIRRYQIGQTATITAVKLLAGRVWFELDQNGWLPAEKTLVTLASQHGQTGLYQQLPATAKLTNLKLPAEITERQAIQPPLPTSPLAHYFQRTTTQTLSTTTAQQKRLADLMPVS